MPDDLPTDEPQREVRITIREEDMIAAQRASSSTNLKPIALAVVLPLAAVFLLVILFLDVEAMPAELWRLMTDVFFGMLIVLLPGVILARLAWLRWGVPWAARRAFHQVRARPWEVVVSWDPIKVRFHSDDSETRIAFAKYLRWVENRDVILLYQSSNVFQFLPKRAFDPRQVDDLRSLARQAGLRGADPER